MTMMTYFWRSPLATRLLSSTVNLPNRCNILNYCHYLNYYCCDCCYYAYYMNFPVHCCNMIAIVTANEWNLRIWLEFYVKNFFGLDYFENEKYFLEINRYEKIQKSRFRNDEVITVLYINFFLLIINKF